MSMRPSGLKVTLARLGQSARKYASASLTRPHAQTLSQLVHDQGRLQGGVVLAFAPEGTDEADLDQLRQSIMPVGVSVSATGEQQPRPEYPLDTLPETSALLSLLLAETGRWLLVEAAEEAPDDPQLESDTAPRHWIIGGEVLLPVFSGASAAEIAHALLWAWSLPQEMNAFLLQSASAQLADLAEDGPPKRPEALLAQFAADVVGAVFSAYDDEGYVIWLDDSIHVPPEPVGGWGA